MKEIIFGKLGGLLLVTALLLIGLGQITALVRERQVQHMNAVSSVSQSLAGSQTLLGPLVQMACTEEWNEAASIQQRAFARVLAPSSLGVGGHSQVEARARGLHAPGLAHRGTCQGAGWVGVGVHAIRLELLDRGHAALGCAHHHGQRPPDWNKTLKSTDRRTLHALRSTWRQDAPTWGL